MPLHMAIVGGAAHSMGLRAPSGQVAVLAAPTLFGLQTLLLGGGA